MIACARVLLAYEFAGLLVVGEILTSTRIPGGTVPGTKSFIFSREMRANRIRLSLGAKIG